jgi:O-antigen ligase
VAMTPATLDQREVKSQGMAALAYGALLVFTLLYYLRPEDVIPGLSRLPAAKISGGIALIGLIAGIAGGQARTRLPFEIKLLLLLFAQLCLAIPFAYWRGGALRIVFEAFSKAVVVGLLVALLITTTAQLRKVLYVQAASTAVVTIISLLVHRTLQGRLIGAMSGIFENSNDLAINIAINIPLCLAFLLLARGPLRKGLWAGGLLAMLYGVAATYSRSGFLALVAGMFVVLLEFGVRGRRIGVIAIALLTAALALAVPSHYRDRLTTILTLQEDAEDNGELMSGASLEGRQSLLEQSITTTLQHPFFGVGPGNFQATAGQWRVAHNTFTQLSAEAGIPALLLFLWLLARAYFNLHLSRKTMLYRENKEFRVLTGALLASLAAYVVGAMFSDTAYELFPYYLVAYTVVLCRVGSAAEKQGVLAGRGTEPNSLTELPGAESLPGWATPLRWTRR